MISRSNQTEQGVSGVNVLEDVCPADTIVYYCCDSTLDCVGELRVSKNAFSQNHVLPTSVCKSRM